MTQIGTPLRDAAVDPRPGDFMPTVEVPGHPGVLRHLEVDEPGYAAVVAAHKEELNG